MKINHTFLIAKLLYILKCLSIFPSMYMRPGRNVIFAAPIKDRKLKLLDNIPITEEHNQLLNIHSNWTVIQHVLGYFDIFFIFSPISFVYGQIFKIFEVNKTKITFIISLKKQYGSRIAFIGYFYMFHKIYPYLWCFWSNFQNFLG